MVVEVTASHPTQPGELRIHTPEFAKFCHLKAALSRHLDCDPRSIHLVRNGGGAYSAYRDDEQLTVVGVDFDKAASSLVTVSEEDMVEDSFGRVKPRPGRNVHAGDDDEPPPLVPGSGFGTFGGLGGIRGFSTLGSLGSRGLIAHKAQAAASSDEELEEVTCLQRELRDHFAEDKFQARLDEIEKKADGPGELARKRQELMLEVQSVVLPKYGFEGSRAGVYKMMAAMGPYVEQPEFTELAEEINSLLGLRSPPETWRGLSRACARASKEQVPNGLDGGDGAGGGYPNSTANGMNGKETFDNVKGIAQPGVWPSDKKPPFKLSIAGSWNGFVPDDMEWEDGLFVFPMEVGDDGWDCFQLLQNGSWDKVIYPSLEEAGASDKYSICGPDNGGHDRSWQIGKDESEEATPGSHFVVCVSLDDKGKVSRVSWEKL
eukprot:symbB.v1.2.015474.t1/scaffold1156.1/size134879/4